MIIPTTSMLATGTRVLPLSVRAVNAFRRAWLAVAVFCPCEFLEPRK
jgi:hypothetical protein